MTLQIRDGHGSCGSHAWQGTKIWEDMRMVQGLRSILTFCVVSGHTYLLSSIMLDSTDTRIMLEEALPLMKQMFMWIMALSSVAVDIFWFLSGFFFVMNLIHRFPSVPPFVSLRFLIHLAVSRLLRLWPLYATVALMWRGMGVKGCIRISELFFLRNLFVKYDESVSHQFCIGHGWSLNVDFQAHGAILGVIAFSSSWRSVMQRLLSIVFCLTVIRSISWVYVGRPVSQASSLVDVIADDEYISHVANALGMNRGLVTPNDPSSATRYASHIAYQPFYFATLFRCAPAFVGSALPIALKQRVMMVYSIRKSPLVTLCFIAMIWYFFVLGFKVPFDGRTSDEMSQTINSTWFLIYEGGGRVLVCVGMAMVIILWYDPKDEPWDENSAVVRVFRKISHAVFGNRLTMSLSKLSYAIFLNHVNMSWCVGNVWPKLSKENFSLGMVYLNSIKLYVASALFCMPICIIEEKILLMRRKALVWCNEKLKI